MCLTAGVQRQTNSNDHLYVLRCTGPTHYKQVSNKFVSHIVQFYTQDTHKTHTRLLQRHTQTITKISQTF